MQQEHREYAPPREMREKLEREPEPTRGDVLDVVSGHLSDFLSEMEKDGIRVADQEKSVDDPALAESLAEFKTREAISALEAVRAAVEAGEAMRMADAIDVFDDKLSREIKLKATTQALEQFRRIFSGIEDYALFASTALYLHGKRIGKELASPPGDLDVVVAKQESLDVMRERLSNTDSVVLDNAGAYKKFQGERTSVLSGYLLLHSEGADEVIRYPFEIFYQSRFIPNAVIHERMSIEGMNVLSMHGLHEQYMNNLEYENRVKIETHGHDGVLSFLRNQVIASSIQQELSAWKEARERQQSFTPSDELLGIMHRVSLSLDELDHFYELESEGAQDAELMALVTGGGKEKVEKRKAKLLAIRRLLAGFEVEDHRV